MIINNLCLFLTFIVGDQRQKSYVLSGLENPVENPGCSQQPLADLCNLGLVVNDYWILHTSGCNLVYTAIRNGTQETITFDSCMTIYDCWFPFTTVSVCLYRHDILAEPNRQLRLAWISEEKGKWGLSQSPQSVLTYGHYAGNLSSSVDLYGIVNDESSDEAAVFLIGKEYYLLRIKLLSLGTNELRPTRVCERDHEVIIVSATKYDVLIVCDNEMYWMKIGRWKPVKATPRELANVTFTRASVNSYTEEFSNTSVGLIAVNTAGNLEYCFTGPSSQYPVDQCGVIPNVYLTRGMLVTRNNFFDIQFLAILNEGLLAVINMSSNDSYIAINTDFCYSHNCNLMVQTDSMVYIGNQQETLVLYKDTLRINATWNVGVRETLTVVENYLRQRNVKMSPSLSTSNTPISNIQQTTASTGLTTAFTSLTMFTSLTTMSTDLINASTDLINTSTDLINTSTSLIASTGLISIPIDLTTSTSSISTFTINSSSTFTQTGSSIVSTTLPRISSSVGNHYSTNNTHTDQKSETVTLVFAVVIVVALVVVIFLVLLVIILLAIRCCKCGDGVVSKSNQLEMDHREVKLSQESKQTKEPLQTAERNEGEVVMIPPDTGMYSQTYASMTTTTDSTVVSTASSNTTIKVKTRVELLQNTKL